MSNKWILFGSIVIVLVVCIVYLAFVNNKSDSSQSSSDEKFMVTTATAGKCTQGQLESILLTWLKDEPIDFADPTAMGTGSILGVKPDCFSYEAYAAKKTDGTKDQYYETYGQFLAKLFGDPVQLAKYMESTFDNYTATLKDKAFNAGNPNTQAGFARKFLTEIMFPVKTILANIKTAINTDRMKASGAQLYTSANGYDPAYLDEVLLYIDAWNAKYAGLKESDMTPGAKNPLMLFLESPAGVGYDYVDVANNQIKSYLAKFTDYLFNFTGVDKANAVRCNVSPDILPNSSQALVTMAAYTFVRALYLERKERRLALSNTDPMYMLTADNVKTVIAGFDKGMIFGVDIASKIVNGYYADEVKSVNLSTSQQATTSAKEIEWNYIIDAEISDVNGGMKLRSAMDTNKPGIPYPNPKLLDELMNFKKKCDAVDTTKSECRDIVKVVCVNIANLMVGQACRVPVMPAFSMTPTVMTTSICGTSGSSTSTTAAATASTAAASTASTSAASTASTSAASTASTSATSTASTSAASTASTSAATTTTGPNIALDTSMQELYNFLRSKLGILYDGRQGDLSEDIIKLLQTVGPVERASLCQVNCNLKSECTPLCKELKCPNCYINRADSDKAGLPDTTLGFSGIHDSYTLTDYLQGDYLGIRPNIENTKNPAPLQAARGPVVNQKDTNGISNVFAPYIVMMPKRPGDTYGSYLVNDPNDPAYRDFIERLVTNY